MVSRAVRPIPNFQPEAEALYAPSDSPGSSSAVILPFTVEFNSDFYAYTLVIHSVCGSGWMSLPGADGRCITCPAGSTGTTATGSLECSPCTIGTYGIIDDPTCLNCPFGGTTNAVGATSCVSLPGFAPDPATANAFIACRTPDICPGNSTCAQGYQGDGCGDCAPSFYPSDSICKACPSAGAIASVFVVFIVLIF